MFFISQLSSSPVQLKELGSFYRMQDFYSTQTIVVTGAAGFIGSHLVDRLLELGAHVVGVDNLITGRLVNIEHLQQHSGFHFVKADASQNPDKYLPTDFKPDLIFHFASPATPKQFKRIPVEIYQVNAFGSHEILHYLKRVHTSARFIFASTSEAYGDPEEHPQKENYWGHVNPNGLRSCYDESKRLGETIAGIHFREFGMDTRLVRIFNTYGPRINPADGRVIPNFVSQALTSRRYTIYGDGSQTRSYCFVSDLVDVICRFGASPDLAGETINIGNPDEHTILETAQLVDQVMVEMGLITESVSRPEFEFLPLPIDDPVRRQPDISKAKLLLNWQPKVSFEQGLRQTIKYFLDHEEL